ncbi:ABC transporter ATP-binding protein [Gluconacetobacter sacchari]|uniref:sn-glycerol-3-phosphate ABC transporter ATP-binding protein UgpC n=2 Tax=Gluconacetobacter sacchari TaxID=92759 RepID=A0A7W4IGE9_9PROT|nr:sn-glycerol-3-phosphate ABC transporter ATP-binding protein UgpC [Gluconacetobacter sacchari]MBB2162304.1 sn-glycerol-3-phosphate ABC transporter ATP-binding protein UgpC [Gluconacetobacter sacchari]GBQ20391.1 nitrate/sulfonate/bicarbonate transporter ATP-binding protein [Gluconacetobacter sacchari DSM 12717]
MALVELKNIRKTYHAEEIVRGVSLSVARGEFVVFVGPSGCGKSTLLRMIAGLEDISSGELLMDGQLMNAVEPARRGLAMVFQSYALYPHMTVRRNMEFNLRLAKLPAAERARRVEDVARILKLDSCLDCKPGALSGGQRQRVAIGRAIVRNPKLFLFDEPLSNLDAELRGHMRVELAMLHRRLGATTIYVTHDQVEAMTMADRIVVLRQGAIEQVGTPLDLYLHPRNRFVAGFIGSPAMNFIPLTILKTGGAETRVALSCGVHLTLPIGCPSRLAGTSATLGIRPEHIHVMDGADAPLRGTILTVEHLGALTFLHVRLGRAETVVIQVGGYRDGRVGADLSFCFPPASCHLFDVTGASVARMMADEAPSQA